MSKQTRCDGCGRMFGGRPLIHVKSTVKPPEHPPVDFDTIACFKSWLAIQPKQAA